MAKKSNQRVECTPELIDMVCGLLASGESMLKISKRPDMPAVSTLYKMIRENPTFKEMVVIASEDRADAIFEEILSIADDAGGDYEVAPDGKLVFIPENVNRARLKVDARKWVVARMSPKKYGERASLDVNANVNVTNTSERLSKARARRLKVEGQKDEQH